MDKDKFISNIRISCDVAYVDNSNKQKVKPTLALFSKELTTILQDEYGEEANEIINFLEFFPDHIIQPILTVSIAKGDKVKEGSML